MAPPAERTATPASTAPTCDAADALPEDLDNPDLPMVAARFWRPLLGLDGPADDADDDGGLLPHQRRPVARRLLQATPLQRVQYLSFLNFFCATVIQEVSALLEAASRRDAGNARSSEPPPSTSLASSLDEVVALDEDEPEDMEEEGTVHFEPDDEENDDVATRQTIQTSSTGRKRARESSLLTFALVLEGMSAALLTLPAADRQPVAVMLFSRAASICPGGAHLDMLRAALGHVLPAVLPSVIADPDGPRQVQWLATWQDVVLRHLPEASDSVDVEAPQQLLTPAPGALVACENVDASTAGPPEVPGPGPEAIVPYDSDDDGSSNLPAPVTQLMLLLTLRMLPSLTCWSPLRLLVRRCRPSYRESGYLVGNVWLSLSLALLWLEMLMLLLTGHFSLTLDLTRWRLLRPRGPRLNSFWHNNELRDGPRCLLLCWLMSLQHMLGI